MDALVRNENSEIIVKDIPEPFILNDDEVKIRVEYLSFCSDDMRYKDESDIFSRQGVLGHEAVGVIEDLGRNAKYNGFSVNDRVMVMPISFCGMCEHCLSQKVQFCEEAYLTIGTMTKYIIRKAKQLIKIPDNITNKQAILSEAVGSAIEVFNELEIDHNKRVLIIGAGLTGQLFIKLLKMKGVKSITVIEPIKERRELALKNGADIVLSPNEKNLQLKVENSCNFLGFNVVIETSSDVKMLEEAPRYLCKGGVLQIFTYYGTSEFVSFSTLDMYARNITIKWKSLCSLRSLRESFSLIKSLSLDELITNEYTFKDILEAKKDFENKKHIKVGIKDI